MNSAKSLSTDNSEGYNPDRRNAEQQQTQIVINLKHQLLAWIDSVFPQRARILIDCLCGHYLQSSPITVDDVEHSALWNRQC
ncbi:MAG: elongation factor P hydroxylase [Gammaproteobacteria bacterium]|nr:elongation factor P hydroxylase [Gammaproteobacteria bacterium]